jgi:hypothetical protein
MLLAQIYKMIKLKPLLNELWSPGSLTSGDDELQSYAETSIKQDNPEWFMSHGTNNWQDKKAYCSAYVTEAGGKPVRFWAEVKTRWLRKPNDTHSSHHERVRKAIAKVSKAWAGEAKRLHKEYAVTEVGNRKTRNWQECFEMALQSPKVAPFIIESGHDQAMVDPVNFTPRK